MFHLDPYTLDLAGARRLIDENGRATIVTAGPEGLRATYGFMMLGDTTPYDDDTIAVVGHIARADPQAAHLRAGADTMLIFDGPHGYISASWYRPTETIIPGTWNYSAVHLRGTPEVLQGDEAFAVIERTVARHESKLPPETRWELAGDSLDFARRIAPGTCVFRLVASDIEAKAKLSQDKPEAVATSVIAALEQPGPHQNPALAEHMRAANRP